MKAAIYTQYGTPEVLQVTDIAQPALKDDDDGIVLVKVHNASVNPYDNLFRKGYLPVRVTHGLMKPKTQLLGIDVAGTIVAVSKNVGDLKVGDAVFGNCLGSHAEYVRARVSSISKIPQGTTFAEAAALPTAVLTALQALRDLGGVKQGQRVLINGASGGVGHFAVQLAKYFGAEVTAVCSTSNQGWVKELGADHMIDYTKVDFTKNGEKYDVILDAVAKRTFFSCKGSLKANGLYITENPLKPVYHPIQILLGRFVGGGKQVKTHIAQPNSQDLTFVADLVQKGYLKPIIEKRFSLERIADAHRHVENGHTKGKVIVEI